MFLFSHYNYSYIKNRLEEHYHQKVSLPTVIERAKQHGFYWKKPRRTVHDKEVSTNYVGELIQHDSSHHLWAPPAKEKWYLITSLDDYSRFILHGALVKKETSLWPCGQFFFPMGFLIPIMLIPSLIFRFVQGRDSFWRKHHLLTDLPGGQTGEADT